MPNWRAEIKRRLAGLNLGPVREGEIVEELSEHLDDRYEELLQIGATEEQAYRMALAELSNDQLLFQGLRWVERTVKYEAVVLGSRRKSMSGNLLQDLRYGVRMIGKNPGFAFIAVLTLALGIGANTAIFSVINGVLLKPLPYKEPQQLVRIFESHERRPRFPMSPPNFQDYREQNSTLEAMAIYTREDLELSMDDKPERLAAMHITAGFFELLGIQPLLGREFNRDEELLANSRVVVLSHNLWQRRFAGDPQIVGKAITLSGRPYTIIGVMPAGVQHVGGDYRSLPHGESVDVWWPMALTSEDWRNVRGHFTNAIGRLKPGVTLAQAAADFNVVAERLEQNYVESNKGWRIVLRPLHEDIVGQARTTLWILLGAVVFVLLVACANVANLTLVKATVREREIALRAALGANRGRIIRQLLTESMLLSVLGGAAGLVLAALALKVLLLLAPAQLPRLQAISIDGRIFAFTTMISLLTGLIFGLAPALQSMKVNLNELLKEGGRSATGGITKRRVRDALVVAEVALALILLIGAGLLLRSFVKLQQTDPGFESSGVLTMTLSMPRARYPKEEQVMDFYQRLTESVKALPGVRAAGLSSDLPWTGYDENSGFNIEGKDLPPGQSPAGRYHFVSADYFRAIGVPLLAGRFFNASDTAQAPYRILINQSLANRYWPDEEAVGKRITFRDEPKSDKDWFTVVGVVGDVKDYPYSLAAEPAFYWPVTQYSHNEMTLAVRTDGDPMGLIAAIRDRVSDLDKDLALADVKKLDMISAAAIAGQRFTLLLTSLFAFTALTLAAIGIYGVMSYLVTQRTHEIGIRMALGAQVADVFKLVLRQGLILMLTGVGLGLGGAFALTRVLSSLLFGVSSTDPVTFIAVPLILAATALVACCIPARRAMRVDPIVALRYE